MSSTYNHTITVRKLHGEQVLIAESPAKRKIVRAGRRGGKTTVAAWIAVHAFLAGRRVLYAVPTLEQVERFWTECKRALQEPLDAGHLYKHEGLHIIAWPGLRSRIQSNALSDSDSVSGEESRIRAKTAWDADSLRGDYADLLILDEWQLMGEDAWGRVGAPMLLDNNGDAVFIYTPPSLRSSSRTKAKNPYHASEMYKRAGQDTSGRWQSFHFASHANPHISEEALQDITEDMTVLAYEQEILALDKEDDPNALWNRDMIENNRVTRHPPLLEIIVGVDPPGGRAECGIIVAGIAILNNERHLYVLGDYSIAAPPDVWGSAAVTAYYLHEANKIVGESNYGGDMVEHVIRTVVVAGGDDTEQPGEVPFELVRASRGKAVRAEPVSTVYAKNRGHHVGKFPVLETELCSWVPSSGAKSPNRLDALVWAASGLLFGKKKKPRKIVRPMR